MHFETVLQCTADELVSVFKKWISGNVTEIERKNISVVTAAWLLSRQ